MKRLFHHYSTWEDWKDGMYRSANSQEDIIERAARLLKSTKLLRHAMMHCAFVWKHSAEQNLSNRSRNRQAWLGQAACCYLVGSTEDITKQAWHRLTSAQQDQANAVADEVILLWERENAETRTWN